MKMKKKPSFLYQKLIELIKNDSFCGAEEDVKNIEVMVGSRFRISKGDLRICLKEIQENYGEFKSRKRRNRPTLTF